MYIVQSIFGLHRTKISSSRSEASITSFRVLLKAVWNFPDWVFELFRTRMVEDGPRRSVVGWGRVRVSRHRASTSPVAVRARRGGGGGAPCPEVAALLAAPKSPLLLPYLASYSREGREHLVRPLAPCSLAEVRDRLAPRLVALVVEEVVEGLSLLHAAGLVHGSLSTATVFLARGGQVRLGDWGLGDMVEPAASRQWGSPDPRRPEAASPARDVWGVGVLVAELALAFLPYRSYRTAANSLLAAIRATDLPTGTVDLAAACLAPGVDTSSNLGQLDCQVLLGNPVEMKEIIVNPQGDFIHQAR